MTSALPPLPPNTAFNRSARVSTASTADTIKNFGRGSEVGAMLQRLYGGKPNQYSTYDPELASLLAQQRAHRIATTAPKMRPVPKSQARVRVPRMTGRGPSCSDQYEGRRYYAFGGKKLLPTIEAESAAMPRPDVPAPARNLIGAAEKERLQLHMQFDGDVPEPQAPAPPPRPPTPPKQDNKALFSTILGEIEERKQFLDEMRKVGQAQRYENKIKGEIASRVADLRTLDKAIKAEEAAA
eukprot:NODE_3607_length_872_cov_21.914094_g3585_i0.p1 GENE.NODE_3607_length_872_cov_21.914094_g3585_i0~~NODE_3607_length_872_cov_21.914094_g3585_i0.p1  ORF type:complete len:282 (+),score=57.56 NODE_3607_length_872_cov_21.914094_g3585_i0:128-847(+)